MNKQLLTAILDATGAILAIWVGTLVDPETAKMIIATWVALQPVLLAVIVMVSYENKAKLEAASRDKQAELEAASRDSQTAAYVQYGQMIQAATGAQQPPTQNGASRRR